MKRGSRRMLAAQEEDRDARFEVEEPGDVALLCIGRDKEVRL